VAKKTGDENPPRGSRRTGKTGKSARASSKRSAEAAKPSRPASRRKKAGSQAKAAGAAPGAETAAQSEPRQPAKSPLSPEELERFKQILLEKRARILGDLQTIHKESPGSRKESSGDLSSMPSHPADVGTDNFEREVVFGLMQNEHKLLREIDEALQRIANGTYGVCVATGKPISKARLQAKPWARYCIEYARLVEEGRAPRV